MLVEAFTFPLIAVIVVIPASPGKNKPWESMLPALEVQIIGSEISEPPESKTDAENRTGWSGVVSITCASIVIDAGVAAIVG